MAVDKTFLGTGWSFPPQFHSGAQGGILVSREEDIQESLYILLSTSPGERPLQPDYGCGLRELMFESMTTSAVTELKDIIERSILFFEPRITLDRIDIDTSEQHAGILKIRLNYTVRATNNRSNMVYPFYFREGTQVRI
jgi:phage baseplate assembly protein W